MTKELKKSTGIRQRGEGWFEVNFRPYKGAKIVQRNIRVATIGEAKLERARMMVEAQQAPTPAIPNTIGQATDFMGIWAVLEADIKTEGSSLNNLVGLRGAYYRVFIDFIAKKYPKMISPLELTAPFFLDYRNYFVAELLRPKGLREELKRVKTLLSKMHAREFVTEKLLLDIKRIKKFLPAPNKKEYPEFTRTEIKTLMDFIRQDRPDYYGPIYFMLRTGRRIEEVTLIERKDIIWDGFKPKEINIRAETTKMDRAAPLNYLDDELMAHIRLYHNLGKDHQAPFLFLNNQYRKCLQEALRRYLQRLSKEILGVSIGCHYFRHRFCTEAFKAKLPPIDIQAICGIKDIATMIRKYCHVSTEGQGAVLDSSKL